MLMRYFIYLFIAQKMVARLTQYAKGPHLLVLSIVTYTNNCLANMTPLNTNPLREKILGKSTLLPFKLPPDIHFMPWNKRR